MTMIDTRLTVRGKYTLCESSGMPATAERSEPVVRNFIKDPGRFGPEYLVNCLEIHALDQQSVSGAMASLKETHSRMMDVLNKQRLAALGVGIHPLMEWKTQTPLPNPHNESIAAITPFRGKRFVGNGLHIYVGSAAFADDPDMAISVMNQIRFFLPHLLALSASSPFWNGYDDSGTASYRAANLLTGEEMFGGMPHAFKDYDEYMRMASTMADVLPSIKTNSDVSFNAERQQLEIRIMDMVPDFSRIEMLAALCQSLVVTLADIYQQKVPLDTSMWVNRLNRGMAALHGTSDKAQFVSLTGDALSWKDTAQELSAFVQDAAKTLGCVESLSEMATVRSFSQDMRDAYGTHMFDESPDVQDCLTAATEFALRKSAET